MIHCMLAIWSLVPLPFPKPAWTSGSSQFTYCWWKCINAAATLENCLSVSSKVKHTLTLWLSDFPPRFLSKRSLCTSAQENLIQTFTAALVKIPPNWKQFKCHQLMNTETNCVTFMVWSVKSYKNKRKKVSYQYTKHHGWISIAYAKWKKPDCKDKILHNSIICLSGKEKT